jgi:DNA-binding CsgD family transcriptional regulator
VIGQRLARLGPDVNQTLEAAAVLGDGFRAAMLGRPRGEVLAALETAASVGMVRDTGEDYRFGHPLIQETLYLRLRSPQRQDLHAAAVQAIESVFSANLEPHVPALATHCRLAGPNVAPESAIDYTLRAGDRSAGAFAHEDAIASYEAALGLDDAAGRNPARRGGILSRLARQYVRKQPDMVYAAGLGEEAAALFEEAGQIDSAIAEHLFTSRTHTSPRAAFDLSKALAHLRRAEELAASGDPARICRVLTEKAFASGQALRMGETADAIDRAIEIAERLADDVLLAGILEIAPFREFAEGHVEAALAASRDSHSTAGRAPVRRHHTLEVAVFCAWEYLADLPLCEEWMARRDEIGFPAPINSFVLYLVSGGRLDEAVAFLDEIGRRVAPDDWLLEFMKDDQHEAFEANLEARVAESRRTGFLAEVMDALNYLGASHAQRGSVDTAEHLFEEGIQLTLDAPEMGVELQFRLRLVELHARLGNTAEAEEHLARALELVGGQDWHGTMGKLRRAQAALCFAEGNSAEAEALMTEAIDLFQRFGLVWEEAAALHIWGRALSRGRASRARAVEKLEAARDIYREYGAGERWAAAVEADVARISGAGLPAAFPDSLSQREVEVLKLIANGSSNREIADTLVLSVRTVERHIANLYNKAGLRNKAQATDYAHRHNLT